MFELFRAVFAPPRDLILLIAAAWAGLALADKRARQTGIGEKAIDTLVGAMVLGFLLGGRLLYAAEHLSAFINSSVSLASLNVGLFDVWAGVACAAIAAAVAMQRKQLAVWEMLDLLAPFFAAASVGLALAHIASGAAFGRETSAPWAINLWGAQRHPTQFYELVAGLVVISVIWYFGSHNTVPGKVFCVWLVLAAGSRLVIEGFRGDSTLVFGGLRLAQIIAWLVLAAALVGVEIAQRRETHAVDEEHVVESAQRNKRQRGAQGKNSTQ